MHPFKILFEKKKIEPFIEVKKILNKSKTHREQLLNTFCNLLFPR